MDGEVVLKRPMSPLGTSPWSSFHSAKLPQVKPPGTPVRQFQVPSLALPVDLTPSRVPTAPHQAAQMVEEVKEHFSDLDLMLEYKLLYLHHCPGVYVIPSVKSLHEWHGVIFVRSGPFHSGVFRFTIYIPDGYPNLRPMVKFITPVYHPYVHTENGSLNLLRGFPSWQPKSHHIWNVVEYLASCFYQEETWLEDESRENFEEEAKRSVEESLKRLIDPTINEGGLSVCFKENDDKTFQEILLTMAKGELPHPPEVRPSLLSTVTDQVKQWWKGIT